MRLYLINPNNPLVNLANVQESWWNRYRVWKPLGLLVLAGMTGPEWEVTVFDENVHRQDYSLLPKPDLVGITAFTSQAPRAYELADEFHARGIQVVMGGIHATMCREEALSHVDCVVTGEAEAIWPTVLEHAQHGTLERTYHGEHIDLATMPQARHDLLSEGYAFGSIQTTRGCPLDCNFCSVSAFNGKLYRHRPIADVIQEMKTIREKRVLVVDDNLIGTSKVHIARAKELFRAMIDANLKKEWVCQVTINIADDEELLALAAKAGFTGVFIGFESTTADGLAEVGKKFNNRQDRDFAASVQRIHDHGILTVGSFIMGLDADEPGIGLQIDKTARQYGLDIINVLFLTPLPGTHLWDQMLEQDRIAANDFPKDWGRYTLGFPTARYKNFTAAELAEEMVACDGRFFSRSRILGRLWGSLLGRRHPLMAMASNLSYRHNSHLARRMFEQMDLVAPERPAHWLKQLGQRVLRWTRRNIPVPYITPGR